MLTPILFTAALSAGGLADRASLQTQFQQLSREADGKMGVCAMDLLGGEAVCVNPDQRFPLQSVMKLIVGAKVVEAYSGPARSGSTEEVVRPEDASPGPQEFADLVKSKGSLKVTIDELLTRAIVDSDSTSIDFLLTQLGGVQAVQEFLHSHKIAAIRVDRNERDLQSESEGLHWRNEFSDSKKFTKAVKAVSDKDRRLARANYFTDPRDTATPLAMVKFLRSLAKGELLAKEPTEKLLAILEKTNTGADRLKAGLPAGWRLQHKTGTGRVWEGVTSTVNDSGVMITPDGTRIAVAVFISGSRLSDKEQAKLIADVAKAVVEASHVPKQGS